MPTPFGHSGIFQSQVSTRLFDGFRHRQFANGLLHRQSSFQAKVRKIYSYYTTPQVRKTLVRRKTRLYCLGSRDRRRSEVRNKVIARVLKEAELIEQWGRGIQKLTRLCLEAGLKKPDIIESGMFVQVVFYRDAEMAGEKTGRENRAKKPDEKTGRKNRTKGSGRATCYKSGEMKSDS